ncbi:MAG: hypothetical protein CO088_00700 [Candidatus Yonathbacteria bacterium CG_4_9_14_0_8_um_filter_46_47]|uniref:Uncharacterized protein n=2 Tax=Parcubacteria group TaxID=1794811 RepID=A0A2M8D9E4_9BACT|nr:MAG: hypothetical protein AUJ44_03015 [Candidatus Nomurabacteria bacterium CG1_02_47_685]PIP03953.1 MAG: hypothetical protein COX54_01500 [Candidatus Yonathbacteria bacterium CG23_combo_of_CG06-09_8_20_14_all_46_18]PIQ33240.1 MAG: hypothetical protein COW61_00275 [Candidatus Yonathbacteria bacterium CG17_big_fil_post_rev_8_21_14_2_50_46_19]PIY57435.1 MAG: hypothetical protein COY99_03370 [Candidatus Yonathbacteria bacterium CG_4_10_14_0_8_um_filter_47_645]PJB83782.1 MAG: hypothetical protein
MQTVKDASLAELNILLANERSMIETVREEALRRRTLLINIRHQWNGKKTAPTDNNSMSRASAN